MKGMNTIKIPSSMTAFMLNIQNKLKDDKPKEYFEKTKKEGSHKNALAKWVHQHKMQNVNTSDDEREVEQEYQKF